MLETRPVLLGLFCHFIGLRGILKRFSLSNIRIVIMAIPSPFLRTHRPTLTKKGLSKSKAVLLLNQEFLKQVDRKRLLFVVVLSLIMRPTLSPLIMTRRTLSPLTALTARKRLSPSTSYWAPRVVMPRMICSLHSLPRPLCTTRKIGRTDQPPNVITTSVPGMDAARVVAANMIGLNLA